MRFVQGTLNLWVTAPSAPTKTGVSFGFSVHILLIAVSAPDIFAVSWILNVRCFHVHLTSYCHICQTVSETCLLSLQAIGFSLLGVGNLAIGQLVCDFKCFCASVSSTSAMYKC